jgi:hypothetical protein
MNSVLLPPLFKVYNILGICLDANEYQLNNEVEAKQRQNAPRKLHFAKEKEELP